MTDFEHLLALLIGYEEDMEKKFKENESIFVSTYSEDKNEQYQEKKTGIRNLGLYDFDDGNSLFRFSYHTKNTVLGESLPILITPFHLYEIIIDINQDWGKEIEERYATTHILLKEAIIEWLKQYPIKRRKLFDKLKDPHYTKKWDLKDLWMYKPLYLLGLSPLYDLCPSSSLYSILQDEDLIWNPLLIGLKVDFYIISILVSYHWNSNITTEDLFMILMRDELGIRSFKDLENIESAICYLIYRKDWITKKFRNDGFSEARKRGDEYFASDDYRSHTTSFSKYLEKNEGFDGEFWASYEEFMHDEWLDNNFEISNTHLNNLYFELKGHAA